MLPPWAGAAARNAGSPGESALRRPVPPMLYFPPWIGSTTGPWLAVIVALATGLIALVLALRSSRRPPPPPQSRAAIQDILAHELRRSQVPETSGVRWEIALYPETLSVPGYVVLTAILQNAYDKPRTVMLEIVPGAL